MNKEKLIKGLMYLSGFAISIFLSAILLSVGFKNQVILIFGFLFLPLIFFFAYKGFKFILEAIFD